jgi:preprotein translocase subunit Sss1
MIPFWHFGTNARKPTLQENLRAFKIVGILLLSVTVAYATIALIVFGHL